MRYRHVLRGSIALGALAFSLEASASEIQEYTYDALGRLVAVEYSGSVNSGQAHSICYDPAGNRTVYKSSSTGGLAGCATSTPTPTPTPTNTPPAANTDSTSMAICSFKTVNVVGNDTDADGDVPLEVVDVSGGLPGVSASASGTTSVRLESFSQTGTFAVTYTIEDTRGATDTGTLNVAVTGSGTCAMPLSGEAETAAPEGDSS